MTGELVETVCPACSGCGVDGYVTVGGEDWVEGCSLCSARGVIEVCPICGTTPCAFTDACECSSEVAWAATFTDWLGAA